MMSWTNKIPVLATTRCAVADEFIEINKSKNYTKMRKQNN